MSLRELLPLRVVLAVSLGLVACTSACTSQTEDDFQNPPPGPPATCTVDPAVAGCSGGSVGYTCAGDRPDDGDENLVCSDGTPGAAGVTVYCCAPYGQSWSDCTVDTSVPGCVGDAFGFRCSGPESPAAADASLACSEGAPGGDGDTIYCCNSLVLPPACAACQADGAACGTGSPCCSGQCGGDDGATCAPASCGANGATCACLSNGALCSSAGDCCSGLCVDQACAAPAAGCADVAAVEYTCTSGTTPAALDSALVCEPGPSGNFCCTPASE